jgi:hypothetical protein
MRKDMVPPETLKSSKEGGRECMCDPVLFWTLFAVVAANIIVVAIAIFERASLKHQPTLESSTAATTPMTRSQRGA